MVYIYNDEDNVPMNDDQVLDVTTYSSKEEMKADERGEALPFTDPPEDGCWNCFNFDWTREACTIRWNNLDESYYNPDLDAREATDCCEYHDKDKSVKWEDWAGDT